MRRPSSPRHGAGRAPAPARGRCGPTSFAGRSRARPGGGTPIRGRPGRHDAGRCRGRARRPPTALSRPLRVVGPPRRSGPDSSGLPRARAACGGRSPHRRMRSSSAALEHEQVLMRQMFLQLTELGEATEDTRRRVPLAELISGATTGEAAAVLEQLAGCPAPGCRRRLGRDRPRGADPRMAAAARMAGGGSGRAPCPPAADDRGSLVGGERTRRRRPLPRARAWRPRSSWRGDERQLSPRRARVPGGEPGRPGRASSQSAQRRARRLRVLCSRSSRRRWWWR